MRRFFFSNAISDPLLSFALLLLRSAIALMMLIGHGWEKFQTFEAKKESFPTPEFILLKWMNPTSSLVCTIFAEVLCCAFIVIGFATRVSAAFLAFTMAIGAFVIHASHPTFSSGGPAKELALLYLIPSIFLILTGAGKFSIDAKLSQPKRRMFT